MDEGDSMRRIAASGAALTLGVALGIWPAEATASPPSEPVAEEASEPRAVRDLSAAVPHSEPTRGFEYGLRSGISLPFGYSSGRNRLADEYDWRVPIWVDLGYRIDSAWYIALYAQAGLAKAGNACRRVVQADDAKCNVEDFRLGLLTELDLLTGDHLELWVGLGVGWEVVTETSDFVMPAEEASVEDDGPVPIEIEENRHGPTIGAQIGVDFAIEGPLEAGPFLGYTAGAYVGRDVECPAMDDCPSDGIDEAALHHWIVLGGRGTFGP